LNPSFIFGPGKKRGIAYTKIARGLFIFDPRREILLIEAKYFASSVALCRRWRYGLYHYPEASPVDVMRRAANFLIPVTLITAYYVFWAGVMALLLINVPVVREFFPVGGLGDLAGGYDDSLEIIYSEAQQTILAPNGPLRLLFASLGAAILIIPVSWVYFITSRTKDVEQSFVQTIIVMPIVVTGIATIVLNSLPLAFALAGVVAAVRFRFTLDQPSHAMYIFVAISIGLGSGIGALGITMVISMAFVYSTLIIWKLQYGKVLSGPFFSMLTRRDRTEDDY